MANTIGTAGEPRGLPLSAWLFSSPPAPALSYLQGDRKADVAIIGGGFTGATAALELARGGARVIIVDATEPGWGASGRNNGQVIPGLKHNPDQLIALYGTERGARLAEWAGAAPAFVFELIEKHRIQCHPARKGWIQPAYTRSAVAVIEDRCEQWARRGADVQMLQTCDLPSILGTDQFLAAWIDRRGGSINPLAYARGLIDAAIRAGVEVYADTPALSMERSGSDWRLRTPAGSVLAKKVFVATGGYGGELVDGLAKSFVRVRTAQVATEPLPPEWRSRILPGGQCASDTRRLLTSFRLSPDGRLVMGGASATGSLNDAALLPHLHRAGHELFGSSLSWALGWSGYFAVTKDHLPHVHETGDGVWCSLGCNGRGIAVSTGLGHMVAKRIQGVRASDMAIEPSKMKPFFFHAFRNIGIAVATEFKRVQDRVDRRASLPAK